ncbi:hypothetical protein [Vogesella indigofera]|uniref:Uncharacterized protein n=1 Tax=Vogesella indigofera TaxID=45465 RepID=A0ABT5I8R1_VOGIN|nr:hypothetical protein [Vogesella indigofera]MDC7692412.1 hypothetical protein [Vogesella indigofera]
MQRPDQTGVLHPTVVDKSIPPDKTAPMRPVPLAQAVENGASPETSRPLLSAADGRCRDGGSFHGNACAFGSPFLWILSFGEAKESIPPPRGKRQIKNIRAADSTNKNKVGRKAFITGDQPY